MIYIYSEINLNCVEPRKGPCAKLLTKVHKFDLVLTDTENMTSHYISLHQNNVYKTNLKYRRDKIPENGGTLISVICAAQFHFDVIFSMTLDFVS